MDQQDYYKDGVARVLDLMRDTFGDYFKAYFNGDPENIPDSLMPCLIVHETVGSVDSDATGTDRITETIEIILVENKLQDLNGEPNTDLTEFRLRKLVKGMEPTTRQYYPQTVMYALRKHITLSGAALNTSIDTDFNLNIRGANTLTQEANVTLTIERLAFVPVRDEN